VHLLDSWLDLVVHYDELFDALQLQAPSLVGHSFGGLLAAELAAATARSVSRLVLIDPVGLWRDDLPVKNWMLLSARERKSALFADADGEPAGKFFAVPTDATERVDALAQMIWSQACTGKFVWPLPDRGLKNRLHRIVAPTLILWGKADRIIDPAYAQEFSQRIAGAKALLIDNAGHLPHLERREAAAKAVQEFVSR
jgi:pimeloyl-ACP methyl ester carboxylesterase